MPALRVIQTQTAGVDHVLHAVPPGVTLCNARGVHDASTAELAVGLMIASQRGLDDYFHAQDDARWEPTVLRPSLADATVLLIGYGSIGAALERRLAGFEVELIKVASRPRGGVHGVDELPTLLPRADIVVLLVPLTDATRGLVDAEFLARMHDDALLVNVARGGVVDTDALVAETSSGRLRAALDVADPEPLPPEHALWRVARRPDHPACRRRIDRDGAPHASPSSSISSSGSPADHRCATSFLPGTERTRPESVV